MGMLFLVNYNIVSKSSEDLIWPRKLLLLYIFNIVFIFMFVFKIY